MKNFFVGLIIGVVICGIIGFVMHPKVKKAGYDEGYKTGTEEGMAQGTKQGIAEGIERLKAEQQHTQDSIALVRERIEAERRAAARRRYKKPEPVQNWHVVNGKIGEPILNEPEKKEEPQYN